MVGTAIDDDTQDAAGAPASSPQRRRRVQGRQFKVGGRLTTLKLERHVWEAVERIARRERLTVAELLCYIDAAKGQGLTASIRVFAIAYLLAGERPELAAILASLRD